jgi:hypothetical protein
LSAPPQKFYGAMTVDFPFAIFRLSFVIDKAAYIPMTNDKRKMANGKSNHPSISPGC